MGFLLGVGVGVTLTLDGERTGHLALGATEAGGVVELAGGVLEAKPEQLPTRGGDVLDQLAVAEIAHLAREAMRLAGHKLPVRTKFVLREDA